VTIAAIGLPAQGAALDPVSMTWSGVILVVLLLLSALFSGSEVALFSLTSAEREDLAAATDRASIRVSRLLEKPRALLNSILILNTFVNVGAAVLAAMLTHDLAEAFQWNPTLTVFSEIVVLTFVLLVVSEVSPKLLASSHALSYSRRVSLPLLGLHRVLLPLSSAIAGRMQSLRGRFSPAGKHLSAEDVRAMAEIGEAHGTIEQDERELINSIVEFGETMVREIMVTRLDIVALASTASLADAIATIRETGHSRLPLYVEHLDNILGVVYAKDILPFLSGTERPEHVDWTVLVRPPIFVPLGKKLDDLLSVFQSQKTHIALVVDEYGGTAGLVTLEDVLEEIVGDIRDEHDESEEALYQELPDGSHRFDARIDLDEMNDILGTNLDTESFDFETLGGLIFHLCGAIPEVQDQVAFNGLLLRVESVEHNRIGQVIVAPESPPPISSVPDEER
jgi:magnesium and cobalt exporter, CNNM family